MGLELCVDGFYRWSINAFSYLRNVTKEFKRRIPKFDEPFISIDWPQYLAPNRVAVAGETLFVHCQVRWYRTSR